MVISVPSPQDIEIYKEKPSPVCSFINDVTKMLDITPQEMALRAGLLEAQEGVNVKCFVTTTLNPV